MDKRENGRGPGPAAAPQDAADARPLQPSRREFLTGALAFSGLALSGGLLDAAVAHASTTATAAPTVTDPLDIGEIAATDGRLRGVITVRSGQRMLPGTDSTSLGPHMPLRFLEGKNATGQVVWPRDEASLAPSVFPGPTLRARVGDQVELTFLNHVNVAEFGNAIDRVERGLDNDCQRVVDGQTGTEIYPGHTPSTANDQAPNCFHGSSTSNLHFHGTHITPDGLGDNVLLQLRPDPQVTEASVEHDFDLIFRAGPPRSWDDLPRSWRDRQIELLRQYDDTAPWQGKNPTPGHPALPPEQRLLPPTLELVNRGAWPQYQVGAYPYCFRLTKYTEDAQGNPTGPAMGQSPGTHWYHAHKHGSTAINVYNGMVGAFIVEGEYDDALNQTYRHLVERVLLVQNLSDEPGLMRGGKGAAQTLYVNGRPTPTLTMRPGEIQLWRLVNASVRSVTTLLGFTPAPGTTGPAPEMRQTAQDGVQLKWENFRDQPRLTAASTDASRANTFAAGNRVDLLVRAPDHAGRWVFNLGDTLHGAPVPATIFNLEVRTDTSAMMNFPTQQQYPAFPRYLADIDPATIHIYRKLDFGWKGNLAAPGLGSGRAPQFTIDGRQFEGDRYDQTMVLGDAEEWTLVNTTAQIAHPFHIHVNPFQVVEIYDPGTNTRYKPAGNYIWQDTVAIPPSRLDPGGKVIGEPGYVKIRHRFVDFTGSYVLHCHMLAHEDRGMMQLLRVISARTMVPHH